MSNTAPSRADPVVCCAVVRSVKLCNAVMWWCDVKSYDKEPSKCTGMLRSLLTHWGHFPDDFFKRIFLNENVWISLKISLKFVPQGPINNIPALVQIMAWRRPGDKPLSEPMIVSLLTHICVTRPQWVNSIQVSTVAARKTLTANKPIAVGEPINWPNLL